MIPVDPSLSSVFSGRVTDLGRTQSMSCGQSGFTLIEVLVAVALSAVIMMAMFTMFDSVTDVALSVRKQEAASNGIRALEGILFEDLRSVYAAEESEFQFYGSSGAFLGGDGEVMGFCTSASLGDNMDGASFSLQRVEYLFKKESATGTLYRREKQYCGQAGDWPWVTVPVLRRIAELKLEFFDAGSNSFLSEWNAGNNRYPAQVKMLVVDEDGREQIFSVGLSAMAAERL